MAQLDMETMEAMATMVAMEDMAAMATMEITVAMVIMEIMVAMETTEDMGALVDLVMDTVVQGTLNRYYALLSNKICLILLIGTEIFPLFSGDSYRMADLVANMAMVTVTVTDTDMATEMDMEMDTEMDLDGRNETTHSI